MMPMGCNPQKPALNSCELLMGMDFTLQNGEWT